MSQRASTLNLPAIETSVTMRQQSANSDSAVTTVQHRAMALLAADCAEQALHRFEAARPVDRRPRLAIEAARAWVQGQVNIAQARNAAFGAHAAAREAGCPSACAAARAAGHAAATAHVHRHAQHALTYAKKALNDPPAQAAGPRLKGKQ